MILSAALADGLASPSPSTPPLRRFSTSVSPASPAAAADHDVAKVATAGKNSNGRLILARILALASPPPPPSSTGVQHAYENNTGHGGGGRATLFNEGNHSNHKSSITMTDDSNINSSYHNNNSMGDDIIIENDDNDNELFPMQQYEICETIDESMSGLHEFPSTTTADTSTVTTAGSNVRKVTSTATEIHHSFDYDWILDGSDDSEMDDDDDEEDAVFNETIVSKPQRRRRRRRRRDFGDAELDLMLGKMELESSASSYAATSTHSSVSRKRRSSDSCGADVDGGNAENGVEGVVSTEEEMVEFGDFSSADFGGVFDGDVDNVEPEWAGNNIERKEEAVRDSFEVNESIISTGVIPHLKSSDVNGMILAPTRASREVEEESDDDEIEECKPPQSIECLVSNLNAELDAAISNCLYSSPDKSNDSASEASTLQDGKDSDTCLMEVLNEEKPAQMPMKSFPQSLLMSSVLMESLPLPMPSSLSDDHVASFTRRMQKHHMELHDVDAAHSTVQIQDEQLEQKLSDTIHHGYFDSADENDTDHYDPIVMEEIMNVPWPFHVLDLDETFLNDEDSDDDPNSDEKSIDDLHFDTYTSNRLMELDFASGEIMDCLLSRVYQQEDAINNGVETIFAAEIAISTAILYSNSCREFLHRARDGYQLSSIQHDLTGHHNVITSSFNVLRIADSMDRLQNLLATVDEISSIFDKEVRWMRDVKSTMIAHQRFQIILDDAKRMTDMVPREEVLNQISCLLPLRARLNRLPEVLQERVEESLANLFSRVLHCDEKNIVAFDEYCTEYESLLTAWLSCVRMMMDNNQSALQSHISAVEMAWAGCISKIFCFETKKAVACSIIDFHRERPSAGTLENSAMEEILVQLNQTKFNVTDESTLESLSQRLMRFGGGHNSSALSSPFFHLSSRLVEVMNLYVMTLQWLESLIAKAESANEPLAFMLPLKNEHGTSQSDNSLVSSVSSEKQLSSYADEESTEDIENEKTSSSPLPEDIEFRRYHSCSTSDEYKTVHNATECIRRAIWDHCEMALIQLVDVYLSVDTRFASGESTDSATRNFHSTYDVLLQFSAFSSYFLGEDEDDESKQCTAVESELSKLYLKHLRSVHVEAMKTTGTILRHEAWQLAPLELPRYASTTIEKDCKCIYSQQSCALCNEKIIRSVYQAVGDLLLGSVHDNIKSEHRRLITTRAEHSGYRRLISLEEFLDNSAHVHSDSIQQSPWRVQGCGMISAEFASAVLPFVEMNACGERTITILTQSSSNGLVRWTTRLLAIGNALPLVAKDASAAVMTLIDLYILTVFRFCGGSKLNEDVLIGFGRGTAASSAASTSGSLTIEADALAPLPRERRVIRQTQEFITSSRNRLKDIVNLDKFQSSSDTCTTPPRSNNVVPTFARRLEKEAAAACSCFFVAILVDVASTIFNDEKDQLSQQQPLWADLKDMVSSSEKCEYSNDLRHYAAKFVAVVPTLVAQTTRFATVNSISGKELVFKIMCCGRTFENQCMQEQSNAYVDALCERSASLWGHLSSSTRLPPPALHYTWNHLVWSAFMLLLEGFSKVNCSMEGRSLMSMDLATLSHGLMPETVMAELEDDYSDIGPPPQTCREGMMRYVDAFIKVFYFPNEDILSWITENAKDYHLDHSMSLITSKASGSKDKNFITDGKNAIATIYYEQSRH